MEQKANKTSVANALQRKANKLDVETAMSRKAESSDIQNLLSTIEGKATRNELERLESILETKADQKDLLVLNDALQYKAEQSDLDALQSQQQQILQELDALKQLQERDFSETRKLLEESRFEINQSLTTKAGAKDIDKLYAKCNSKIDSETYAKAQYEFRDEIAHEIKDLTDGMAQFRKTTEDSISQKQRKNEQIVEILREEVLRLQSDLKRGTEEQKSKEEQNTVVQNTIQTGMKREFQKDIQILQNELDRFRKECAESLLIFQPKEEFVNFKNNILATLEEKTDLEEVQTALNACQTDVSQRFLEFKEEVQAIANENQNRFLELLDKKANFIDVHNALSQKPDNNNMLSLLSSKVNIADVDEIRKIVDRIARESEEKTLKKDFDLFFSSVNHQIEEIQQEVILKCNVKDICVLLDTKSNIDDTNRALGDIHKELEKMAYQEDLNQVLNEQTSINEQLCTENIVARWTWKSGELKAGSLVPWESQPINTLPDNFLWEKDNTFILTVAPGLYEVSLGFFSKKKPIVQLLVNGEPIVSVASSSQNSTNNSSNKMKDTKSSGGISTQGLTLRDFFILPARARISVTYVGEYGGEGFFGLKRL